MRDSSFERKGGSRQLPDTCRPAFAFSVLFRSNAARRRSSHPRLRIHSQPTQRTRAVIRWELRDLALSRLGTPPQYVDARSAAEKGEHGKRITGSDGIDVKLKENSNKYTNCGVIARAMSKHRNLVSRNRLLNQEKFDLLTQAQVHTYAAEHLIPELERQLQTLLKEITDARDRLTAALGAFPRARDAGLLNNEANPYH